MARLLVFICLLMTLTASNTNTIKLVEIKQTQAHIAPVIAMPILELPKIYSINTTIVTKPKSPIATEPNDWDSIFNSMAAKLPGQYVIADKGSWGATDLRTGIVYIARRTPLQYLKSVMLHESIHVRQGYVYGNINTARAALANFGGLEAIADCGAKLLGATWTNYVNNCSPDMLYAAQAMLSGVSA